MGKLILKEPWKNSAKISAEKINDVAPFYELVARERVEIMRIDFDFLIHEHLMEGFVVKFNLYWRLI
jgi:hypothetical protein